MGSHIVEKVPTAEVEKFCKRHRRAGATKCESTARGDGMSDVLVEYPSREPYAATQARAGK